MQHPSSTATTYSPNKGARAHGALVEWLQFAETVFETLKPFMTKSDLGCWEIVLKDEAMEAAKRYDLKINDSGYWIVSHVGKYFKKKGRERREGGRMVSSNTTGI